jgi:hypothetical protein
MLQSMTPNRQVMVNYLERLTDEADPFMHWRFLPERGTDEEKRGHELDRAWLRPRRKTKRRFAIRRNFQGKLSELWEWICRYQDGTAIEGQLNPWGIFPIPNGAQNDKLVEMIRVVYSDRDGSNPNSKKRSERTWHGVPAHGTTWRSEEKYHDYWKLSDCSKEKFRELQQRIASFYGSDKGIINPSRVMRIPGSIHWKNNTPTMVNWDRPWTDADTYTVAEFEVGLPELPKLSREHTTSGSGAPVTAAEMRETLSWIDPEKCEEPIWRNQVLAPINAANLVGDDTGAIRLAFRARFQ